MTEWADLERELDVRAAAGAAVTFWWRDDDATTATPALERLLGLRAAFDLPLALAVIPARVQADLAARLAGEAAVAVLQHGWGHDNHAPPGAAKAELGPHRPLGFMLGELARGWLALDRLFGGGWLKVLVPPHNRIAPALAAALPRQGHVGLSTFGPVKRGVPDLAQVNAHVDIMDWTTRGFLGEEACLTAALGALRSSREGGAATAPIGLLTHHLAHDGAAWAFAEAFIARTKRHAAVRWAGAPALFAAGRAA